MESMGRQRRRHHHRGGGATSKIALLWIVGISIVFVASLGSIILGMSLWRSADLSQQQQQELQQLPNQQQVQQQQHLQRQQQQEPVHYDNHNNNYTFFGTREDGLHLPPLHNETYLLSRRRNGWGACSSETIPNCVVRYVRSRRIIHNMQQHRLKKQHQQEQQQQQQQPCTPILDVLGWIMDQAAASATTTTATATETSIVNHPPATPPHTLIITGGSLIKVLREKDFVRVEDDSFIDDDIDVLTSLSTFDFLATLEPMLWATHGWTIRYFVHCQKETIFAQLVAVCGGHKYSRQCGKSKNHGGKQEQHGYKYPAIDVYPYISLMEGMEFGVNSSSSTSSSSSASASVLMDFWETSLVPSSLIFPSRHISLISRASTNVLQLYIPSQAETILTCLYGNWHVYSNATTKSFYNKKSIRTLYKCFEEGIPDDLQNRTDAILAYQMARMRQQQAQKTK
jgi:hypothetical protein